MLPLPLTSSILIREPKTRVLVRRACIKKWNKTTELVLHCISIVLRRDWICVCDLGNAICNFDDLSHELNAHLFSFKMGIIKYKDEGEF